MIVNLCVFRVCDIRNEIDDETDLIVCYLHQLILSILGMDYILVQSIMQIYCDLHTIRNEWQRNETVKIKVI